ncbi:hypothetical protein ABTK03_20855, partial [Acinetobacter baumannii]
YQFELHAVLLPSASTLNRSCVAFYAQASEPAIVALGKMKVQKTKPRIKRGLQDTAVWPMWIKP